MRCMHVSVRLLYHVASVRLQVKKRLGSGEEFGFLLSCIGFNDKDDGKFQSGLGRIAQMEVEKIWIKPEAANDSGSPWVG